MDYTTEIEALESKLSSGYFTMLMAHVACPKALSEEESVAERHVALIRKTLEGFKEVEEIGITEDSLFLTFPTATEALRFSLLWQDNLRAFTEEVGSSISSQIGIHSLNPANPEQSGQGKSLSLTRQVELCQLLAGLASDQHILMARPVFDHVRAALKKEDLKDTGPLIWTNHGPHEVSGLDEPLEICAVTTAESAAPVNSEKAKALPNDQKSVWGWQPGVGAVVPGTRCVLEERCADGRLGEVWAGSDEAANDRRTFNFCFRADWVQQLRREETTFQRLRKKVGQNRNIVSIQGFSFEQPPFYIMTEFVEGKDLKTWCQELGGLAGIPLSSRIELVGQAAAAFQAAHEAGIIHRDLRPEYIILSGSGESPKHVQVKLSDFGIGHIGLQPALPRVTPSESAEDLAPSEPAAPTEEPTYYKAPELITGAVPSKKSDLYSLGVVFCQLLLGNFSEFPNADRIKEIVGALKREKLLPFFAAKPEERAEAAAGLARELRALNKDRETRVTWRRVMSPKHLVRTAILTGLAVIAFAVLWVYTLKHPTPPKKAKAVQAAKPQAKAENRPPTRVEQVPAGVPIQPQSSEEATEENRNSRSQGGVVYTTKARPSGKAHRAPRSVKAKEELSQSGVLLFKFLVFPLVGVVVIGTLLQRYGSQLMGLIRRTLPTKPS